MYKFIIRLGITTSAGALLFASAALAAPVNFVSNISISNPEALVGENLKLTTRLQKLSQIKKVEIKNDGKTFATCKTNKIVCTVTMAKFSDTDVGDHIITIVVTPKKGAAFSSIVNYSVVGDTDKETVLQTDSDIVNGTDQYFIDFKAKNKFIPAKNDLYPALDSLSASTFEPRVGKKWHLTAWAKNKSELAGMGVYIDEEIPDSGIGSNCVMCEKNNYPANSGRLLGPFTKNDIGEHNYGILLVGKNGKRRVIQGTFEVKP